MTIHYTVLAEVDRQRREQLAAGIAATRRPARRLRWWHRDHLPQPHPATHPVAAATA